MARWIQVNLSERYELLYIFANTGCEHEKTLEFVQACNDAWNLDIHWVEAVVHHGERKGCTHNTVTFETAARNGEPFEAVIEKYGIPNKAYPHCTRELKLGPITSLMESKGFKDAVTAVGIRADEVDRISPTHKEKKIIYPLISMIPTRLGDIRAWWNKQPFDLDLPEHLGNCVACHKKSFRKLRTVADEMPHAFDFTARMEAEHGLSGHNVDGNKRVFFRGNRNTQDIFDMKLSDPFVESSALQTDLFWDAAGGCSESCDIYAD